MKVLKVTLVEWQTLNDWLVGKGLNWFKVDGNGDVDPGSTSITTDGYYVINLDKMDKIQQLKDTQAWINHKDQIKTRIFNIEDVDIDRSLD